MPTEAERSVITTHTFPTNDSVFAERVREIVRGVPTSDANATVQALTTRLRAVHPHVAAAIRSDMAGFGDHVVYVYRDGSAVPALRGDEWISDAGTARLVTDESGTYVDANNAAATLFGVSRSDILGTAAGTYTRPDARVEDGDALWRALAATGRLHSRAIVCRTDGTDVPVEFVTVRNGEGPGRSVTYLRQVA